jgi:hypothetical protein
MPYNPGVQNQQAQLIYAALSHAGQSMGQGMRDAMLAIGQRAKRTKELRSELKDAYPERGKEFGKMNLEQLSGFMKAQADLERKQQQSYLAMQIAAMQQKMVDDQAGKAALATALKQAAPAVQTQDMSVATGLPTSLNNPFGVSVTSRGAPDPNALVSAIMQNPAALNTPMGQSVLASFLKSGASRGTPEMTNLGGVDLAGWICSLTVRRGSLWSRRSARPMQRMGRGRLMGAGMWTRARGRG